MSIEITNTLTITNPDGLTSAHMSATKQGKPEFLLGEVRTVLNEENTVLTISYESSDVRPGWVDAVAASLADCAVRLNYSEPNQGVMGFREYQAGQLVWVYDAAGEVTLVDFLACGWDVESYKEWRFEPEWLEAEVEACEDDPDTATVLLKIIREDLESDDSYLACDGSEDDCDCEERNAWMLRSVDAYRN